MKTQRSIRRRRCVRGEELESRHLLSCLCGDAEVPEPREDGLAGQAIEGTPFVPPSIQVTPTNQVQQVRVAVLNYEPTVPSEGNQTLWQIFNWNDPRTLAQGYIDDLETASGGAVDYQVVDWRDLNEFPIFQDGFRYTADQYVQNRRTGTGWVNTPMDFYTVAEQQGLAELVNDNVIDEIWMFGDHFFNLLGEAWMAGPNSFFINGPSFPDFPTDRAVAGFSFNYERGVAEMLHNLGHRTENHLSRAYDDDWNISNPVTPWDKFTANVAQSNVATYGVGSIHYPFNGASDYDYANPRTFDSYADDFVFNFPNQAYAAVPTTRDAWGDLQTGDWQRGYLRWFFGHLPRAAETNVDGRQNNWYKYIYDFNSYEPTTGLPRDNEAILGAAPFEADNQPSYELTVRYYDIEGIDASTLGTGDIRVTGPAGFNQLATLVDAGSEQATTSGTARTARYRVTAPGGLWDSPDAGSYSVTLVGNQVRDLTGAFLPSANLGGFRANPSTDGRLDVAALIATGQAAVTATPWDIGNPNAIFDGNFSSLYRSANINPAVVTLSFAQPQIVSSFQTLYGNNTSWKVETADSLGDLDAHTGSYRIAVPPTNVAVDTLSVAVVSPPVTASYFRLTAQRTSGDNYVHIYEWALIGDIVPDVAEPITMLSNLPAAVINHTSSSFEVRYQDDVALDVRTINFGDVLVTGPNGFVQTAAFYGVDANANGITRDATYFVAPPGGVWDVTDNGTYTLQIVGNQVMDTAGKSVPAGLLGSFVVDFPPPESRPLFDMTEQNAEDWLAWADGATATTSDDFVRKVSGATSVRFDTDGGFDTFLRYEPGNGALWDLTDNSTFRLSVFAENPNIGFQIEPIIRFIDVDGDAVEFRYWRNGSPYALWNDARGQWITETINIKSSAQPATGWRATAIGTPDWSSMRTVEIHADTWDAGFSLWFDAVGFDVAEDFNGDFHLDTADVDALVAAIAAGNHSAMFDLTGDQMVNGQDLDAWLIFAGASNLGIGRRYLFGDANLDGVVDVSDFNVWNNNKFTAVAAWSHADFNADGVIDVSDFNLWNANKFNSSNISSRRRLNSFDANCLSATAVETGRISDLHRVDALFALWEGPPRRGTRR